MAAATKTAAAKEADGVPPIVDKAPSKAKVAAKAAAVKTAAAASKSKEAPPTIAKRPAGVDSASSAKFPPVDRKETVYWGGGRMYKAQGDMIRVYARVGDRKDKRFKFTDKASLNVSWEKACRVIADDTRAVL